MRDEEKESYQRIADADAAGAASVTGAERSILFHRPPPEKEDRLCMKEVGLTMPELRARAIASPDSLNEAECDILTGGANHDTRDKSRNPLWINHLPPEEEDIAEKGWNLFDGKQVHEAFKAAWFHDKAVFRPLKEEALRQRERLERENTPKWVNEINDAGLSRTGFFVFRTVYGVETDAAWRNFVDIYMSSCKSHFGSCWRESNSMASKHRSRVDRW